MRFNSEKKKLPSFFRAEDFFASFATLPKKNESGFLMAFDDRRIKTQRDRFSGYQHRFAVWQRKETMYGLGEGLRGCCLAHAGA
jgi:hypothetical protein